MFYVNIITTQLFYINMQNIILKFLYNELKTLSLNMRALERASY
jgi:hypothetical protein